MERGDRFDEWPLCGFVIGLIIGIILGFYGFIFAANDPILCKDNKPCVNESQDFLNK